MMVSPLARPAITIILSRSYMINRLVLTQATASPRRQIGKRSCFVTSTPRENENSNPTTPNPADDGGVCLVGERYKYQSWPSEEHAAFAFARLASPGHTSIGQSEFISVLKRMNLDFNLGDRELGRVFDSLDANGDGRLSLEEFKMGRGSHPFAQALVKAMSGAGALAAEQCEEGGLKFPDPYFDWTFSTAEFYSAPLESGFVGENVSIRKSLDYSYHNNYTKCRQHYQDALIKSNVLLDGHGSEKPWYVLTCGPMGAGKGFVLGWMSAQGILKLEKVSKIDPGELLLRMPEWPVYQKHSMEVAGTKTHAESSYIAEIAQHLAMKNNMDVWVDGSLRNWQWYEGELQRIRKRYPQYRIAVIAISAPEDMIESNIKRRAMETGRDIPPELRRVTIDEIGKGITKLTHLVDLVASVQNTPPEFPDSSTSDSDSDRDTESGDAQVSEPILRFVSLVDRSGNWDLIRELTHI